MSMTADQITTIACRLDKCRDSTNLDIQRHSNALITLLENNDLGNTELTDSLIELHVIARTIANTNPVTFYQPPPIPKET